MKNTAVKIALMLVCLVAIAQAQTEGVMLSIIVSDDVGGSQELNFGTQTGATSALDPSIGEDELPPFPPAGIFEARFVSDNLDGAELGQGCYSDYRTGDASWVGDYEYELKYQVGADGSEITVSWDFPEGITGQLLDLFGGLIVDVEMSGNSSHTITNMAVDRLKMVIHYTAISTGVNAQNMELPETVKLQQNYPNPFNPATMISYQLAVNNEVSLVVLNSLGQRVSTLVKGHQTAGAHQVLWDASGMPSGIYVYKLQVGNVVEMKRMVLVK